MITLLVFAAGYVVGVHSDRNDIGDLVRALRAVRDSSEVHDLTVALRGHAGHALRGVADFVERGAESESLRATAASVLSTDVVERVRRLVGVPDPPD